MSQLAQLPDIRLHASSPLIWIDTRTKFSFLLFKSFLIYDFKFHFLHDNQPLRILSSLKIIQKHNFYHYYFKLKILQKKTINSNSEIILKS